MPGSIINYLRGAGRLPRAAAALFFTIPFAWLAWGDWWTVGISFLLIWLVGFMPGWGKYVLLNDTPLDPGPEVWWIDKIVDRFADHPYEAKLLGTCLRGLHFTAPLVIFLIAMDYAVNPVWAAYGALMGPSYGIAFDRPGDSSVQWERGEKVWGGVLWFGYAMMAYQAGGVL